MTDSPTTIPASAVGHDWTPGEHNWRHHHKKRFSWQPVAAGIAAALALQVVLGLLGLALGLGTVSATDPSAAPSAGTVTLGASMWAAISMISALFYGGFIAARLSKSSCHHEGILHGIVMWAGSVLIVVCLLSSAIGGVLGGAARIVGAIGPLAHMHGPMAPPMGPRAEMGPPPAQKGPDVFKREATDLISGNPGAAPTNMSPEQAQDDIAAQFALMANGGDAAGPAHQRVVADLETQGVSPADAETRVSDWQGKADAAKQKAKEMADKAAHATAKGTLAAAVVLLLSMFTAALGGSLGALHVKHDGERHEHEKMSRT